MQQYDVAIIGAGPAGLTAGLYAGRYRLKSVVFEKLSAGGQIMLSPTIDNFPGFPAGSASSDLIGKLQAQMEDAGVGITDADVQRVDTDDAPYPFHIVTAEQTCAAKTVIVATGAQYKRLGLARESLLTGRGVSYCGTCDGPLFKNKDILVVGGGDRALEEALYLSGYARSVVLVHRRQEFRASPILQEKLRAEAKISYRLDSVIEDIVGETRVESAVVRNVHTGEVQTVVCQGVFIFVGIAPQTQFVKNILQTDESGFIMTRPDAMTSRAGVFACGDCTQKKLYQVVTACADGAVAADSVHKYLMNL